MTEPTPQTNWVDITFDCRPLRTIDRLDIPLDASPKFRQLCERMKGAIERHGTFNTYYLYNARCVYHLTNSETGRIEFRFEGTVFTNDADRETARADLSVELASETCEWLTEPIVAWFRETVQHSVRIEFDRYIAAGDLTKTVERIQQLQNQMEDSGGYVGMFL